MNGQGPAPNDENILQRVAKRMDKSGPRHQGRTGYERSRKRERLT